MPNDPKADLIYAILAMDAYNRGYGAGITDLGDAEGTLLGNFTLLKTAEDQAGIAKSAGFYAIAFEHRVLRADWPLLLLR